MISVNRHPSLRELRSFAGIWMLFFAVVGALVLRRTGSWEAATAIWVAAGAVAALGLAAPAFMRLVFVGMSLLAFPIGWVVSHVLMIGIWALIVTPTGLVRRWLGGDPLERKFDKNAATYWKPRGASPPLTRYRRQF